MISIKLYDILNSIDNTLEKNVKSYDNSFIDNFIDELKNSLLEKDSTSQNLDFNDLPRDSIFYIDYIEEGFASCINTAQRYSGKYEIPVNLLDSSITMGGSYIQFDGEKYVNVNKPKGYSLYN